MGKATGQSKNLRGKIGQMIYYQRKDGTTVVYEAKEKAATPVRTEAQMQIRTQWSNLGAVYTQFHKTLKKGFEGLEAGLSDYNAFIQANVGVCKVYIPKWIRLNGGCVLAEYQFCQGSLPPIGYSVNAGGVLVSNLNLGSLTISATTTVAELTMAILQHNQDWEEGDMLAYFEAEQWEDTDGVPRATMVSQKVVLDSLNDNTLWSVVGERGFSTIQVSGSNYLSMSAALSNQGAAWVHSREKQSGSIKVSSQKLKVVSDILANYQTYQAMKASAASYGGINTKAVYLNPQTYGAVVETSGGTTDSGNNGSTGGGSGNGSVTPTEPNTGGDTGDDTGGNGGGNGGGGTDEN